MKYKLVYLFEPPTAAREAPPIIVEAETYEQACRKVLESIFTCKLEGPLQ